MEVERHVGAARQIQDPQPGNTTITVVVTNQTVRGHDLIQLGRQVHSVASLNLVGVRNRLDMLASMPRSDERTACKR